MAVRLRGAAILAGLALVAAGCGAAEPTTVDALVQERCAGAFIDRGPVTLFAVAEAACPDGSAITWFASTEDRDLWLAVAEAVAEDAGTGLEVLEQGRYFVVTSGGATSAAGGDPAGAGAGRDLPGEDPVFDRLLQACEAGSIDDCTRLFMSSPADSEYESRALDMLLELDATGSEGSGVPDVGADGLAVDPDGEPFYGTISLTAGFSDDPRLTELVAGGAGTTAGLPPTCVGNIGTRPDLRLEYRAGSFPLFIGATSDEGDLTLVVRTPDGRYACEDDTFGTDPEVRIDGPLSGTYDIWVGTYAGDYLDATLYISELEG